VVCATPDRKIVSRISPRRSLSPERTSRGEDLPVDIRELERNLKYLVWQWDPIGVADIAPDDEYDCLVSPLLSKLVNGADRSKISGFLWYELEDHFGLDPRRYDVDAMADRLVAWWAAVGCH
jgi:hypothetical protein